MAYGDPNDPANQQQQSGPRYTVQNQYSQDQGFQNRNTYGGVVGGADQAVNRDRLMGAQGANRSAYAQDFGQAQGARGAQVDALQMMQGAAAGTAPSRAEILGQHMTDDQVAAGMAMAGGASGGPAAQAAAMRLAASNAGATMQTNANNIAGLRADEMARARDAYMSGASGIRGQDLSQVGLQTQNEQFQRGLNQADQQFYEQQAQQTNLAQLAADQGAQHEADANWSAQRGATMADEQFGFDKTMQYANAAAKAGSTAAGVIASDPRAKNDLAPMASGNGGQISPATAPWVFPNLTYSDERSKQAPLPMAREVPMGSLPPWMPPYSTPATTLLTSDARAKQEHREMGRREGFDAGVRYGYFPDEPDLDIPGVAAPPRAPSLQQDNAAEAARVRASFAPGAAQFDPSPGSVGDRAAAAAAPPPRGAPMLGMPAQGGVSGALSGMNGAFQPMGGHTAVFTSDEESKMGASPMASPVSNPRSGGFGIPGLTISDNRAKLAAAWDAGHAAGAQSQGAFVESVLGPPPTPHQPSGPQPRAAATPREPLYVAQGQRTGYTSSDADVSHRMSPGYGAPTVPYKRVGPEPPPPAAAPPAQMMDAIGSGKTFRYKPGVPGTDPTAQKYGTTTQDLRQTPMGASMVTRDPATGYEAIDTREAVGPTLAALGNLNQRMRDLETKRGGR